MKLAVQVQDLKFILSLGEGSQTAKWLGVVAAQRYAMEMRPSGRSRSREPSNHDRGFFLPGGVRGPNGVEVLDPDVKLCDVFDDGALVIVELQQQVEIDADDGGPVHTAFTAGAFCNSEASRMREKLAAGRRKLEAQERNRRMAANKSGLDMNTLIAGELRTEDEVRAAFEFDWESTDFTGSAKGPAVVEEIRLILLEHFRTLNAVFQHYSGEVVPGEPFGVPFQEFLHIMHLYAGFDIVQHRDLLDGQLFAKFAARKAKRLSRANFLRALVAAAKFQTDQQASDATVPESLETILTQFVNPVWEVVSADAAMKALRSDRVKRYLRSSRHRIQRIVETCSESGSTTLTSFEFRNMCSATGIVGTLSTEANSKEKVEKVCHSAIASAHGDPDPDRELNDLVFGEIIHAVARVALDATGGSNESTPVDKVCLAIDQLAHYSTRS